MANMGGDYRETLRPWSQAPETAVTLTTTNKTLVPAGRHKQFATEYFNAKGRAIVMRYWGEMTTAATPGTLALAMLFGDGTDANGTSLAASAAQTLIASQTSISWWAEFIVRCGEIGFATNNGNLLCMGRAQFGTALIAAGSLMIPASAPAPVTTLDLTGSLFPNLQALVSSGSGISMKVHHHEFVPAN
jgi:hypothetical protein